MPRRAGRSSGSRDSRGSLSDPRESGRRAALPPGAPRGATPSSSPPRPKNKRTGLLGPLSSLRPSRQAKIFSLTTEGVYRSVGEIRSKYRGMVGQGPTPLGWVPPQTSPEWVRTAGRSGGGSRVPRGEGSLGSATTRRTPAGDLWQPGLGRASLLKPGANANWVSWPFKPFASRSPSQPPKRPPRPLSGTGLTSNHVPWFQPRSQWRWHCVGSRLCPVTLLNAGCSVRQSVRLYLGNWRTVGAGALAGRTAASLSEGFLHSLPRLLVYPRPPRIPSPGPLFLSPRLETGGLLRPQSPRDGRGWDLPSGGCWGSRGFLAAWPPSTDGSPAPPAGGSRVRGAKRRSINFSAQKSMLLSGRQSMPAQPGLALPGLGAKSWLAGVRD